MNTQTNTQAAKSPHPLAWIAGVAVILFSAVGIGAFMGWIPTSIGKPGEEALPARVASPTAGPAKVAVAKVPPVPVAAARCAECGVIQSVREIETKGEGTGLGAAGGAVVGGVLGSQIGGGDGKKVMAVVGAVGGAVAGHEIEKRVKSHKSYEITVRLDDGSTRTINEANPPSWRNGDKVKVLNGMIQANG